MRAAARLLLAWCLALGAAAASADGAGELRTRYESLRGALADNAFGRPIHIDSRESNDELRGDVHALIDHSFATVGGALKRAEPWCDVLIVVFNIKQCRASGSKAARTLSIAIGRKYDQPVAEASWIEFAFRASQTGDGYFEIELRADDGPLGTHDYRITLEAIPLDAGHAFVHLKYAYAYGMAAKLATRGYLATVGRDKVGFSAIDKRPDGSPVHVGGVRGMIERNAMRYYLAIDAYLDSLAVPPEQQLEKRLSDWFAATERYPRQLREMERDDYLAMKRKEVQRQRAGVAPAQ